MSSRAGVSDPDDAARRSPIADPNDAAQRSPVADPDDAPSRSPVGAIAAFWLYSVVSSMRDKPDLKEFVFSLPAEK